VFAIDLNNLPELNFLIAAAHGQIESFQNILNDQRICIAPDQADEYGTTTPIEAASFDHIDIIDILLADGCIDSTLANLQGNTAPIRVALNDHATIVKPFFADARVDLNHVNVNDHSLLICAAVLAGFGTTQNNSAGISTGAKTHNATAGVMPITVESHISNI